MAASGMSCAKIAAQFNEEGVDTAITWYHRNGRSTMGVQVDEDGRTYWSSSQIHRMIHEELYTGTLVCFKAERVTVGSKSNRKIPRSEWLRIPNTHEAIVSTELFAEANAKLRKNKKHSPRSIDPNRSPLTGKIKCGYCGHTLKFLNHKRPIFTCTGAKLKIGKGCFNGKVYCDELNEVVLSAVQTEARKVYDSRQKRLQMAQSVQADRDAVQSEQKRLTAQITLLERRAISLYEDFADGKLDKDSYISAKGACSREIENAMVSVAELESRLEITHVKSYVSDDEPLLLRVLEAQEISEEVLALVDCITVYDPTRIEVRLTFGDTNI